MDYQVIANLFSKDEILPKYRYKRWVRISDSNNGDYNPPIKYYCKTVADKLVDYSSGYIILEGVIESTTANNLDPGNNIAIKNGSNSIVSEATVRLNNDEVDKNRYIYLTTTYLNLLEYSDDYTKNAIQYGFARDTADGATSTGCALRKNAIVTGFADHRFNIMLKIPLIYLSPFFRRLNFPIINNEINLEVTLRTNNCLLRLDTVQPSRLVVRRTELYLPIVELPQEYEKKLNSLISSSYTKEIQWDHMNVREFPNFVNGQFDSEITPSLNGVRKMYVMAIPQASWDNQEHSETTSNVVINNINITIDSVDYYPQSIRNDHEAYSFLQECFNMSSDDYNTGSLISFVDFKNVYRLYAFDLSHQKIFEENPKKSQSIRLRCEIAGNSKLIVVLSQEKTSQICMSDPSKSRTV
jgi:hypothetical protein